MESSAQLLERPHRPARSGNHQRTGQFRNPFRLMPVRQIGETVGAQDEEELVRGIKAVQLGQGIHRITRAWPILLQIIDAKAWLIRRTTPSKTSLNF